MHLTTGIACCCTRTMTGHTAALATKPMNAECEPKRLGGLEIDDQFVFGWLHG